jgi:hypothetical protein
MNYVQFEKYGFLGLTACILKTACRFGVNFAPNFRIEEEDKQAEAGCSQRENLHEKSGLT